MYWINVYYSESEGHSVVSDSLLPHGLCNPWNSPGQNTGVGSCFLPQGIFPAQRLNPGIPYCRQVLYQPSHQESPRTLEWVAYPFPADLSDPGIKPGSLHCRRTLHQLSCQGRAVHSSKRSQFLNHIMLTIAYEVCVLPFRFYQMETYFAKAYTAVIDKTNSLTQGV